MEEIKEIKLPSGATLLVPVNNGPRLITYSFGLTFGVNILPDNEFTYGTDQWANREIELYEEALEIDLKTHADFIKSCLTTPL